ncbi:PTS sugar transporter subunit IIC [Bacteroides sp. OttesenSCG-928-J23]|nr:PTS sugar transporter subunit IIC [Bacteroides sp. OttesenSCG-928-J23]
MFVQAVLIGLLTWFCASGIEFLCWSVQLCAPIICGPIVGLILGDMQAGLIIGAMTQLVYMGQIMVGGVTAVDYPMAGVVATALTILTGSEPQMGVTIAVSLGLIGLIANNGKMTIQAFFVHNADKCAAKGDARGIFMNNVVYPQILTALFYGVPGFLAVYVGADYFQRLLEMLPEIVLSGLEAVGMLLPALGLAMLLKAIFKVRFFPFFIIGFVFSMYLELNIIAVTLMGASFAVLYWFSENKKTEEAV